MTDVYLARGRSDRRVRGSLTLEVRVHLKTRAQGIETGKPQMRPRSERLTKEATA